MGKNTSVAAAVLVGILLSCGCASTSRHELSRLQGTWVGKEIGGEGGPCQMSIEGDTIKFQGAQPQSWYIGRLTLNPKVHPKQALLLIEECAFPTSVNQTARVIYKCEDKTLTMAGNEPGNEAVPTAFEHNAASHTWAFTFTRR